jgi:ATP synthase I chain
MEWEKLQNTLQKTNWLVLLVLSSFGYFVMSPFWTAGVLFGGLIAIANFSLLQYTVRRAFSPEGIHQGARFSIVGKYYLRLVALGGILYVLITRGWIDPVGLVAGLSTVMVSIIGFAIHVVWRARTKEAI